MADQTQARRRIKEILLSLVKQMEKEGFPMLSEDEVVVEVKKSLEGEKTPETASARTIRPLDEDEFDILCLDFLVYNAFDRVSRALASDGHRHYSDAEDGLYIPFMRDVSRVATTYLRNAAEIECGVQDDQSKTLFLILEDDDFVWKEVTMPQPQGKDLPTGLGDVLNKLGGAGGVILVPIPGQEQPGTSIVPLEGERQREKKHNFTKSENGKVIYLHDPNKSGKKH
jgi:hypothetical protein